MELPEYMQKIRNAMRSNPMEREFSIGNVVEDVVIGKNEPKTLDDLLQLITDKIKATPAGTHVVLLGADPTNPDGVRVTFMVGGRKQTFEEYFPGRAP
jgi:hypothetical protein